jgi:hypothetical protein
MIDVGGGLEAVMQAEPRSPNWSGGLPEGGPPDPTVPVPDAGRVYAYFMTTIRVEVDAGSEVVTEAVVDEGLMQQPTLVLGPAGEAVPAAVRDRVASITARAEWPSWDYGSVRAASSKIEGP